MPSTLHNKIAYFNYFKDSHERQVAHPELGGVFADYEGADEGPPLFHSLSPSTHMIASWSHAFSGEEKTWCTVYTTLVLQECYVM